MSSTKRSPYFDNRRLIPVSKDLALAAQRLRPTSAMSRITAEALRDWIEREKRRASIIAEAER